MRWRFRRQTPEPQVDSIGEEAQRFLSGRYLELAYLNARDVPPWVWISAIAHGDEEVLELASTWMQHHGGRPEFDEWGRLLEHVARRIVSTSRDIDRPLCDLQRDLLIPLELAVFMTPVGPATLYRLITTMLDVVKRGANADNRA
jgi:hypothetical protein